MSGSFSILWFQERDLPDLVCAEQFTSAVYLEQRPDVEHYLVVADRLSGEALTPADTIALSRRWPPRHERASGMTGDEAAGPGDGKRASLPFDISKAHQARVYDYLLGGCFL